ncbi:hypothetical protein EDD16DRAFT_1719307 [Pisolithus croceorrhizus]|nr:hypothetical protein EDD16DRAFT_1719307 [Pisolithus croceorrhizus]
MFPGGLFNNPWHSWCSPNQLEDVQTVRQSDLFDDDMSSAGDPADHNTSTAVLTEPPTRMDSSSSSAHVQAPARASPSFICSNPTPHAAGQHEAPESEHQVNVWSLGDPSHRITPEALESERDVWRLSAPSHCNHPSPEQVSISHVATGKRVEPDTPMDPAEATVVPLPASKCRYEEVDFSRSLRQGLYEKEEIINKLRKKVRQQGKPNDTVTSLQSDLKQKESELLGLHQALDQIQRGQEQTIRQYETQFEELRRQFELNMRSQFDSLQATRMAEIDTRVREEVTKLSSTLQVEKERELANIEQRYARFRKPAYVAKHFDAETDPLAGSLPSRPQASTPSTPNLDAIKRIRKGRGISKRTRLIGVEMDDNGLDRESALPEGCKETGGGATPGTQDDQLDPPPVTAVVEAVTKSVETALRTLLESGGHFSIGAIPRSPRRTPRRRRQENHKLQLEKAMEPNHHCDFILAEVRHLFKEKLGIAQDIDFITHVPANAGDVRAYEYEDGPSPDTDNVAFDLMRNHSSPWNSFILSFLLREFQARCTQEAWPIRKDDDYIEELTAKGLIETPAEQEARLVEENLIQVKESRQATHCRNKYHRRKTVLDRIVTMKSEAPDDDLRSWQWLQRLIKSLGEHGMSSEESSVENGIENVLRVKKMEWRKNIDKELEIIDLQRILDKDIFCSQGAKPLPRKRAPDNPTSSRAPVTALPAALYNEEWISQLTERQRESLKISKEPFPWMKIIAT